MRQAELVIAPEGGSYNRMQALDTSGIRLSHADPPPKEFAARCLDDGIFQATVSRYP
jgi:hypothetical protein